jgi:hypothetical protein
MINFDKSLQHERELRTSFDGYIMQAIQRICNANGLTFEFATNGTAQDDKNGIDLWVKVKQKLNPISVDLKVSNQSKWRIALEWRQGRNQHSQPWALSAKSNLIVWVNPKHEQCFYADSAMLANKLQRLTSDEREWLLGCEYTSTSKCGDSVFESHVSLINHDDFIRFCRSFGGAI